MELWLIRHSGQGQTWKEDYREPMIAHYVPRVIGKLCLAKGLRANDFRLFAAVSCRRNC